MLINNEKFHELINVSEKLTYELYTEELILRFISLYSSWENVKSNLSTFMTEYMKEVVMENKFCDFNDIENIFIRTIDILFPLRKKVFRFQRSGFSTSLFDAIMLGISSNIDFYEKNPKQTEHKIEKLRNSKEFRKHTGSAANSQYRVTKRIKYALETFSV